MKVHKQSFSKSSSNLEWFDDTIDKEMQRGIPKDGLAFHSEVEEALGSQRACRSMH